MKANQYIYLPIKKRFHIYRVTEVSRTDFHAVRVEGEEVYDDRAQALDRTLALNGWRKRISTDKPH